MFIYLFIYIFCIGCLRCNRCFVQSTLTFPYYCLLRFPPWRLPERWLKEKTLRPQRFPTWFGLPGSIPLVVSPRDLGLGCGTPSKWPKMPLKMGVTNHLLTGDDPPSSFTETNIVILVPEQRKTGPKRKGWSPIPTIFVG